MSAIGSSVKNASAGAAASSANPYASVTSQQFLKIMFSELTNQDPMSPNETKDLLQQIGTIRSIESDLQLQKRLDFSAGAGLIGSSISGNAVTTDASGNKVRKPVSGVVKSVVQTSDGVAVRLENGHRVLLSDISQINQIDAAKDKVQAARDRLRALEFGSKLIGSNVEGYAAAEGKKDASLSSGKVVGVTDTTAGVALKLDNKKYILLSLLTRIEGKPVGTAAAGGDAKKSTAE